MFSVAQFPSAQVVHELIETPLKNPSGHGVMVVLRIASEKLGRLAHERQVSLKGTKIRKIRDSSTDKDHQAPNNGLTKYNNVLFRH